MNKPKLIDFYGKWREVYGVDGDHKFLVEQYDLMVAGIRDARIHDNTFTVWEAITGGMGF